VAERPFIVDNGEGGRNGLDYLREWSEMASSIDIATGYLEIGSLLDLDGHWQKFEKIRILMGDEVKHLPRRRCCWRSSSEPKPARSGSAAAVLRA